MGQRPLTIATPAHTFNATSALSAPRPLVPKLAALMLGLPSCPMVAPSLLHQRVPMNKQNSLAIAAIAVTIVIWFYWFYAARFGFALN
jgi:hypothetical protein